MALLYDRLLDLRWAALAAGFAVGCSVDPKGLKDARAMCDPNESWCVKEMQRTLRKGSSGWTPRDYCGDDYPTDTSIAQWSTYYITTGHTWLDPGDWLICGRFDEDREWDTFYWTLTLDPSQQVYIWGVSDDMIRLHFETDAGHVGPKGEPLTAHSGGTKDLAEDLFTNVSEIKLHADAFWGKPGSAFAVTIRAEGGLDPEGLTSFQGGFSGDLDPEGYK